jgi:hypothetical protein
MSNYLLVGPLLLQGFELPQSIQWGGAQRVAIHRLPGGRRVLDSMGRDDREIAWNGIFTGDDGALRARLMDLMRAEGTILPLAWDTFFYSVVVSRFEASFERANWIPYRIACTVLRDEAEGLLEDAVSLATSIAGDLGTADDIAPGLDLASLNLGIASTTLATADPTTAPGLLTTRDTTGSLAQQAIARGYAQRAAANSAADRG